MSLLPGDLAILEFEQRPWRYAGIKEDAIRAELGMTPARYYQTVARLIRQPAAAAHAPMLIARLNRIRQGGAHGSRRRSLDEDRAHWPEGQV